MKEIKVYSVKYNENNKKFDMKFSKDKKHILIINHR